MPALDRPFSYSQLSTYLRCPKMHDYSYRQGLQSVRKSVPLQLGSLVDAGLTTALMERESSDRSCEDLSEFGICEAYDTWSNDPGTAAMLAMVDEFREESHQAMEDSVKIANRAIKKLDLNGDRWETLRDVTGKLGVQYEVTAALEHHEHGYIGKIDWIAKDSQTGFCGVIDWKVRASPQNQESIQYDYQLPSYEKAATHLFAEHFTGVALYQLKSKVPNPPRILKSGKLSTAAHQSCDWDTYSEEVERLGLNLHDYYHMQDKLPEFESWIWTRRGSTELDGIWEHIEAGALELKEAHHGRRPALRVLNSKICGFCDYKELCMAELRGHDSEFIRDNSFTLRE